MANNGRPDADARADIAIDDAGELPYALPLELTVQDPETVAELVSHAEGEERERFALTALRIGVLALRQARGRIDADVVRRESDRLLETLQARFDDHSRHLHDRIAGSLGEYFDPNDGRLHERIERLVRKDGELEAVIRRQIGTEDSELCRTLAVHFGNDSALMRLLRPDQSDGLLASLRDTVEKQLDTQREHVLRQFSLDNKEGALARFIAELCESQDGLTKQLHEKIDVAVRQFSLDDDDSALSRLVRNVREAQQTITSEFSLDDERSALARLRKQLLELMQEDRKTNRDFQEQVKTALAEMRTQRTEAARTTLHGHDFESAVFECIQRQAQRLGDVPTPTGNTPGLIRHCKKGDCVIELGPESAAPGAKFVIEAKEKAGYALPVARAEIEEARKNRAAQVGLFVYSKKCAPPGLEPLGRFGHDVFVVWDAEDPATDVVLQAAVSLARALCVRTHKHDEAVQVDFAEIDRAILEIEKRANSFDEIETSVETIKRQADKIAKTASTARKSLLSQVELLNTRIAATRTALATAAEEPV
ncbi:MAG: hypothetical protein WD069_05135 [Planctomycetales bacterium]